MSYLHFLVTGAGFRTVLLGIIIPPILTTVFLIWKIRSSIEDLEFIKLLLSLFTFGGIAVALAAYLYNRNKDKKSEVANQIAFFREKVIPLEDEFLFERKKLGIERAKIPFESNFFEDLVLDEEMLIIAKKQYADSKKIFNEEGRLIREKHVNVLNLLEEFAVRVKHYQTHNHIALNSLHAVFVDSAENHTTIMFLIREIEQGGEAYAHIIWLYSLWKKRVSSEDAKQRIKRSEVWKKIIWKNEYLKSPKISTE